MPHFSGEINIGNMISLATMLVTLWTFHRSNIRRIEGMNFKVNLMWKRFAHQFNLPENIEGDNDEKL